LTAPDANFALTPCPVAPTSIANRNFLVFYLFTWTVRLLYQSVPAILYFALIAIFRKRADIHYHRFSAHCPPYSSKLTCLLLASRHSLPILPYSRKALSIRPDRFRFSAKVSAPLLNHGQASNTISQPDLPTVAATLSTLEIARTF